jgi:hypothetical protein
LCFLGAHGIVDFQLETATSFGSPTSARVINQNLSHQLRRHRQKVSAVRNFGGPLLHEPEVRLMNECCTLESMVRTFLPEVMPSYAS